MRKVFLLLALLISMDANAARHIREFYCQKMILNGHPGYWCTFENNSLMKKDHVR